MGEDVLAVSVVIPARNEAIRIGPTLAALCAYIQAGSLSWELVVVDDGSTDATAGVVESSGGGGVPVRCVPNAIEPGGKGCALRCGFDAARGAVVVFLDADLPIDPATVQRMAERTGVATGVDVVVGSRRLPNSPAGAQPLGRRVGGTAFLAAVRVLGLRAVSDPQCGAKALWRDSMVGAVGQCREAGFAFDVELTNAAVGAGKVVEEFPVEWHHRDGSTVRPVIDAVTTLRRLVAVRRRQQRRA